jgi:ankyrin repeat protein
LKALPTFLVTDVEFHATDGWTPLIAAAYCGELDICAALLKAGASVKAACKVGLENVWFLRIRT